MRCRRSTGWSTASAAVPTPPAEGSTAWSAGSAAGPTPPAEGSNVRSAGSAAEPTPPAEGSPAWSSRPTPHAKGSTASAASSNTRGGRGKGADWDATGCPPSLYSTKPRHPRVDCPRVRAGGHSFDWRKSGAPLGSQTAHPSNCARRTIVSITIYQDHHALSTSPRSQVYTHRSISDVFGNAFAENAIAKNGFCEEENFERTVMVCARSGHPITAYMRDPIIDWYSRILLISVPGSIF